MLTISQQSASAVIAREQGNLIKSAQLFSDLLPELENLKNSPDPSDQQTYVHIMGEIVIQYRHEGKAALTKALDLAQSLYLYAPRDPNAIRGLSNTLMNLEAYELAEKYLREMLTHIPETNSAWLGDTQAHLSRCLFRTNKLEQANSLIDSALTNISANTANVPVLNIAVWKSHALMVKALILNSQHHRNEAIVLAQKANDLVIKEKLKLRTEEAKQLLDFLRTTPAPDQN
jgi:tetratricopeptide (TPR) repeat protein